MCFGWSKNRLIETVLLSTHNTCFGWEIRKINFSYAFLFESLYCSYMRYLSRKQKCVINYYNCVEQEPIYFRSPPRVPDPRISLPVKLSVMLFSSILLDQSRLPNLLNGALTLPVKLSVMLFPSKLLDQIPLPNLLNRSLTQMACAKAHYNGHLVHQELEIGAKRSTPHLCSITIKQFYVHRVYFRDVVSSLN